MSVGLLGLVVLELEVCHTGCINTVEGGVRGVVDDSGCDVGGVRGPLWGSSGTGLGSALLCVNSIYCRGRLREGTVRNTSGTCWISLSSRSGSCMCRGPCSGSDGLVYCYPYQYHISISFEITHDDFGVTQYHLGYMGNFTQYG